MDDDESLSKAERWARLRFAVVGPLLASPPPPGQLRGELEQLASKHWQHPTKDELVQFGLSTIERWLYDARATDDPIGALRRKPRRDAGLQHAIAEQLAQAVRAQYKDHPKWSYQLHRDNLAVLPGFWSSPPTRRCGVSWSSRACSSSPARRWTPSPAASSAATRPSTSMACGTWTSTTARSRC